MLKPNGPKIIGFCGHPGAGKSEAQKILEQRYGAKPIDDGWPLRDFAMRHLGLTLEDVTTQDGKAKTIVFAGKAFTVRWFLGELGNRLEELLGPDAIPLMAAHQLEPDGFYTVGSIRREQALVWKRYGAVIVHIKNPLAKPSPHEFDRFDASLADVVIDNHALAWGHAPAVARADLMVKLDLVVKDYFGVPPIEDARAA